MKVFVVPYAYDGTIQGVEIFFEEGEASQFADKINKKYKDRGIDLFIMRKEILGNKRSSDEITRILGREGRIKDINIGKEIKMRNEEWIHGISRGAKEIDLLPGNLKKRSSMKLGFPLLMAYYWN